MPGENYVMMDKQHEASRPPGSLHGQERRDDSKKQHSKGEKPSPAEGTRAAASPTLAFSLGSLVVPYGELCSSLETTQRNSAWSSLP